MNKKNKNDKENQKKQSSANLICGIETSTQTNFIDFKINQKSSSTFIKIPNLNINKTENQNQKSKRQAQTTFKFDLKEMDLESIIEMKQFSEEILVFDSSSNLQDQPFQSENHLLMKNNDSNIAIKPVNNSNFSHFLDYLRKYFFLFFLDPKHNLKRITVGITFTIILSSILFYSLFLFRPLTAIAQSCLDNQKKAQEQGLQVENINCQPRDLLGLPFDPQDIQNINLSQAEITNLKEQKKLELEQLETEISQAIKNLTILEVGYSQQSEPKSSLNIEQTLTEKNQYLSFLVKLQEDNLYKLRDQVEILESVITKNRSEFDLSQYQIFLSNFHKQSLNQQIESFPELKRKLPEINRQFVLTLANGSQGGFLTFEGSGFQNILNKINFKNYEKANRVEDFTGNIDLDDIIFSLAEKRGYVIQNQANIEKLVEVDSTNKLQPESKKDWLNLQLEAKNQGIELFLNSGFRNLQDQKELFLDRLKITFKNLTGQDWTPEKLLNSSRKNEIINRVLESTAPPGYSRHHSGFTIDIGDTSSPIFRNSPGYKWLSDNNFAKAKQFGFIPSYPKNVTNQGPEPEEWEYVWIGRELLQAEEI